MTIDNVISEAIAEFKKAEEHLRVEFSRLQIGRASPALVEGVHVELYGVVQPLKAVAGISIPDPRTIQIQPWDRGAISSIEKGILGSGMGLNPINDGICVRINIPPLTEERRAELTKHAKKLSEDAKIAVRNFRQDALAKFKQLKNDNEITEDDLHGGEKSLQEKVEESNKRIDETLRSKEQDIMTV